MKAPFAQMWHLRSKNLIKYGSEAFAFDYLCIPLCINKVNYIPSYERGSAIVILSQTRCEEYSRDSSPRVWERISILFKCIIKWPIFMTAYLLAGLKENTIPPPEFRSTTGNLSQTLSKQSPFSCGLVCSRRILHLRFGKEYLYYYLLWREECTILLPECK